MRSPSNPATQKLRPAIIVAIGDFDDIILIQITSKVYSSTNPVKLTAADFAIGSLPLDSYIRPDKLFNADNSVVSTVYGSVGDAKL